MRHDLRTLTHGNTGGSTQLGRDMDPEVVQQTDHIARPANGHRRGGKPVLEHQQQTHEPGHEFAHRRVGVRVRGSRHRQHRCQLRVAQGDETAQEAGDHEGNHDPGPRILGRCTPGQHEDAGTDDAADSQRDQVQRPEALPEFPLGVFSLHLADGFAYEQTADAGHDRRTGTARHGRRSLSGWASIGCALPRSQSATSQRVDALAATRMQEPI